MSISPASLLSLSRADLRSSERLPFVALHKPAWISWRAQHVVFLSLGVVLGLGAALFLQPSPAAPLPSAPLTASVPEDSSPSSAHNPYDIRLNASALAPDQALDQEADKEVQAVAGVLPDRVMDSISVADSSVLEVDSSAPDPAPESEAEKAQQAIRRGDLKAALGFERQAVAFAPDDFLYRLDLAILCDKLGNKEEALTLYTQVLKAVEAQDETLPDDLDVAGIRVRAAYLATEGSDTK